MTKKHPSSDHDNDCADAWLALAESADAGVSDLIRRTIYRESARDPARVMRWLTSALLLRDLGAVEPDIGFFCVAFATECIAESRYARDPELQRIDRAITTIAQANGVDVEEYDLVEAQPPEVRVLHKEWDARADALEVEVLQQAGALEEADLRRQGFPFAERREAGRWTLFGEVDPLLNIDDEEFDDGKSHDPFLT